MKKIANFLSNLFGPIIAKINWPYKREILTGERIAVESPEYVGCLILTHTPWQLGNLFIPSQYDHVGIITDKCTVIEATSKGVVQTSLIDVLKRVESYTIVQPSFLPKQTRMTVVENAKAFLGTGYDFGFSFKNNKLYCSELIYFAIGSVQVDFEMKMFKSFGREIILPVEFLLDKRFIELCALK